MILERKIYQAFERYGYQWKIDGTLKSPNEIDIRETIDKAKELLYDEEIGHGHTPQLEIGRLIVQKNYDHFDIYMLIGSERVEK